MATTLFFTSSVFEIKNIPMLALLLIPAFIGMALAIDTSDDADDMEQDETPLQEPEDRTPPIGIDQPPATTPATTPVSGTGTGGADILNGQSGNDLLEGLGGADTIDGNGGNDTIFAGGGNDEAVGGAGNDQVFLGGGDDVYSPLADDTDDYGDDLVHGGAGNDGIVDLRGSNALYGDAGNDLIAAFGADQIADAPNTLDGGTGNDTLFGDDGDLMIGADGEDLFAILKPARFETDAVIIEDFNTEEDTLTLFVPQAGTSFETVDLRFDPAENALRAFWRGDEVAVLNGLTSADIPDVRISIFDADDLARGGFS